MKNRVSISILAMSVFAALFVAFNGQTDRVILSMLAYAVGAAVLVVFLSNNSFPTMNLVGAPFGKDGLAGIALGGGFVLLNTLNSAIALGAPAALLSLGAAGLFISIVLVAPVVEEFLFRGLLQDILSNSVGVTLAVILQAFAFSLFHFSVYGGFLGLANAPGLFVGALSFGLVAGFITRKKKGVKLENLETVIIGHMIFNAWLFNLNNPFLAFV